MDMQDSHYEFLGVDMFTSRSTLEAAVERLSKQASALANTSPERSQHIRERLRQIKSDLLTSEESRNAYNRWLLEGEQQSSSDEVPVSVRWGDDHAGARPTSRSTAHAPGIGRRPAQPSVPEEHKRSRRVYWILGGLLLVILAAAGGAFASGAVPGAVKATPTPTATPTATATATPSPTPTPNPAAVQARQRALIRVALNKSNASYLRSMACACDSGLEEVKTGGDLQKYLGQIADMQSKGVRRDVTSHSFSVNSITLETSGSASATVTKDETANVYQNNTLTQICEGPYQVQYHLVKVGGLWKVDDTALPGGGQSCRSP